MIKLLQGLCPHCYKPLDKQGNCSKPCSLGALKIELKIKKKRLQAEINKQKEQDKTTENEVGNNND